jgi:putative ABC transport system permease protein
MLAITLFDLRYRLRQFLIAVLGAALLFAIGMLNAGLANSFHNEVSRLTHDVGADRWIVPAGSTGPLTSLSTTSVTDLQRVRQASGVRAADPLIVLINEAAMLSGRVAQAAVVGFTPGGIGDTRPSHGRDARGTGELVADGRLDAAIGSHIRIAGHSFLVVGTTSGRTVNAGIPVVSMTIQAARAVAFGGRAVQTAIVTRGAPTSAIPGLRALTNAQMRTDTLRPLQSAITSLNNTMELMWVIAAVIVAALLYVSALERVRDFAVLKALGAPNRKIFAGVALQSVLVTLVAAALAASAANLLKPVYPLPVAIPTWAFVTLPGIAVVVGVLASLVALRRAVSVDPSLAFAA